VNKIFSGFESFIETKHLDESEVIIIKWQYGYFGDFYNALIRACRLADLPNKLRIRNSFPELYNAMERYDTEKGFFSSVEAKAEKMGLNRAG